MELSTLQDSLSQVKAELKTATAKNGDLKKSLDQITFQLKKRVRSRGGAGHCTYCTSTVYVYVRVYIAHVHVWADYTCIALMMYMSLMYIHSCRKMKGPKQWTLRAH